MFTSLPGTTISFTTGLPSVNLSTSALALASASRASLEISLATLAVARTLPLTWKMTSTVVSMSLAASSLGQLELPTDRKSAGCPLSHLPDEYFTTTRFSRTFLCHLESGRCDSSRKSSGAIRLRPPDLLTSRRCRSAAGRGSSPPGRGASAAAPEHGRPAGAAGQPRSRGPRRSG